MIRSLMKRFRLKRHAEMIGNADYVVAAAALNAEVARAHRPARDCRDENQAVIMNVGRGPVIDEAPLIAALRRSGFAELRWMYSIESRWPPGILLDPGKCATCRPTAPITRKAGWTTPTNFLSPTSPLCQRVSRCKTL